MKFPSIEEMVKDVAEKALDEYEYQGRTIRQWVEILKDHNDKRDTLQRIVEQLEAMQDNLPTELSHCHEFYVEGMFEGLNRGIKIVKEEGGL